MTTAATLLTRDRFAALAAAWGADPERWPEPERERARAFRSAHADAEAILEAERALDDRLAAWTVPQPPAFLDHAIASRVLSRVSIVRRVRAWLAASAAAAALASGLTAGIALASCASAPLREPVSALYGVPLLGLSSDGLSGPEADAKGLEAATPPDAS